MTNETPFTARAFCFLPLPLRTGFPLHLNGHFALDHEARRNVGKDGYKLKWNYCLANEVIIPAWICGILHLQNYIQESVCTANTWREVNQVLARYHKMFPLQDKTYDEFWNDLICNFYKIVLREKSVIFPCILDTKVVLKPPNEYLNDSKARFHVLWTLVSTDASQSLDFGVFNGIEAHYSSHLIETLLKSFKMKVLCTPLQIWLTIKRFGFSKIPVSTPDLVIEYIKKHTCLEEGQNIGKINTNIKETKYISSLNLKALVAFLQRDKCFYSKLHGLPILLSSDLVLRVCSTEHPVYVSEFALLLPQSAKTFIHEDIRELFDDDQAFDSKCFKRLQMDDFIRLLPENMDPTKFAAASYVTLASNMYDDSKFISKEWLCMFYDFLVSQSLTKIVDNTSIGPTYISSGINESLYVDIDKFRRNVLLFSKWSFLPVVIQKTDHDTETETVLLSVSDIIHVLHLSETFLQDESGKSFKRLALPELDVSAFLSCKYATSIVTAVKRIVASPDNPSLVLECLVYHRRNVEARALTSEDALNILAFLARNLSALQVGEHEDQLRRKIKLLPLFLTQQMSLTAIASQAEVIVLPKEIPFAGMQEWADACSIILLKKNDTVQSLYDFLGLAVSDINTAYAEKILPAFASIPGQYWMTHLDFLRKRLINKKSFTVSEKRIIYRVTELKFISVSGKMKRANELYSPKNDVFACMLNKDCFPPEYLQTKYWYDFLVHLGLNCHVDDKMLLQFASEIERLGINRMTEELRNKSEKLLECFLIDKGSCWQTDTLNNIRSIKFILPYIVSDEMRKVCVQFDNQQQLICFEKAISHKHQMLSWTSLSLISDDTCDRLDANVRKQLCILKQPPVDRVILHCQNVCDSFKSLLKSKDVEKKFVTKQMKQLYKYFNEIDRIDDRTRSRLIHKPIIYLPDDDEIVTVSEVVIGLPDSDQIKPYLYTAPVYYGEYFKLFQNLGCRRPADFCHYSRVLEILKHESNGKKMTIQELRAARKAIQVLFISKSMISRRASECKRLYLPNREMVLTNAKDLVVSDRNSYEDRLQGNVDISFFAGFESLNLIFTDPIAAILSLPDHIRPVLLTEAVTESICWDGITEIENSIKARKIERFLHSECLSNGLSRILKGQPRIHNKEINDTNFAEIKQCLANTTVSHVTDLKTVLYFNGLLISNTDKDIYFYTKRIGEAPLQKQIFYFKDNSDNEKVNITKLLSGLTKLVLSCSSRLNVSSSFYITQMLQEIEHPELIQSVLDDLGIRQFDLPQTRIIEHFPAPGTAVDPSFFPFLEQGIFPFKEYEYESVAMDLDDKVVDFDVDDMQDPVYIYVHIIRNISKPNCSNLEHSYVVNTGNPDILSEVIPIYRLFRFVRKKEETGNAVQPYGDEPVFALPFDENCKHIRDEIQEAWNLSVEDRKRVIRRLYLKWYPDRNPKNRDYCAKVFMYIKVILSRLENREELLTDAHTEIARGPSDFSSSSFYYANIHRRAEAYVQAYNDNVHEYNLSYRRRRGIFTHTQEKRMKRDDVTEAKRWLRQAKCDFFAAKAFLSVADGVDGFNWICYTCHQACEKALKSAYYARDADNVPRGSCSHQLTYLASDDDMRKQARLLEERLGDHTRLRYPNALSRPKTPSDIFNKEDAEFSIDIADKMINLVQDFIS